MKTRTLLLLALACGAAIMLAGAVLLFQLSTQDDAAPAALIGTPVEVGDVTITVLAARVDGERSVVDVRLDAPPDTDPTTGFSLLTPDGRVAPTSVDCPADCVVTFPVAGPSLVYVRGDEQARWVLG